MLIARLTAQLRCYVPEPVDETWGRLRHLGARREQLITEWSARSSRCGRCSSACGRPLWTPPGIRSGPAPGPRPCRWSATAMAATWPGPAASARPGSTGGPPRDHQAGRAEAVAADRARPVRRARRPGRRDRAPPRRAGARQLLLEDWQHNRASWPTPSADGRRPRRTAADRAGHLDHRAVPVGAAAILAETGDPRRFATARALVKHAGLAPREKLSGTFVGRTKLTGQGRPGCAWPRGGRCGAPRRPTPSTPPATGT